MKYIGGGWVKTISKGPREGESMVSCTIKWPGRGEKPRYIHVFKNHNKRTDDDPDFSVFMTYGPPGKKKGE